MSDPVADVEQQEGTVVTTKEQPASEAQPQTPHADDYEHLFSPTEARLASRLGVEFPAFCGVWMAPLDTIEPAKTRPTANGGRAPLAEPEDCPTCLSVWKHRLQSERA